MARGGYPSDKQDQFMVRFPSGLRDRVKASAEAHGRSMNTEIIRVLEREYPEPWPLNVRVKYLTDLVAALRRVRGHEASIDTLIEEVRETVEGIASGRVPDLPLEIQQRVREDLDRWLEERTDDEEERSHWHERDDDTSGLDDEAGDK